MGCPRDLVQRGDDRELGGKLPRWSAGLKAGSGTKRNDGLWECLKLLIESRAQAKDARFPHTIELSKEVDDLTGLAVLEEQGTGIIIRIRLPDASLS